MAQSGMGRNRLEAFSDGVIAIIITIMVLELKVPHEPTLAALGAVWPVFLSYVLSFVYIGIYWNNHHHLLHTVERVSGGILWANLHLLFWLSLVPFASGWIGENHFAALPVAVYGVVMLMAGSAYSLLRRQIIAVHGTESLLFKAVGVDWKGRGSLLLYATALLTASRLPAVAMSIYALVALLWLVPDRRIERVMQS